MPYIPPFQRPQVDVTQAMDVGELTYVFYQAAVRFAYNEDNGPFNFARGAEVVAALESAKHEFQRRHLDPYEDGKRELNGDVTP